MAVAQAKQLVSDHPAETGGPLAMALAVLIADLVGVDDATTLTSIAVVVSFIPALITWIVGLRSKDTPAGDGDGKAEELP